MKGLIIVNWNYASKDLNNLIYPERDGELMERMLTDGGYQTLVVRNEEDIREKVMEYIEKQTERMERFHFHYSGHGKHNVTIMIDPDNYVRRLNSEGEFVTSYSLREDSDLYGDCIIGTSGTLYPVIMLKRDLLKIPANTWTVTLDMCRNDDVNLGTRGVPFRPAPNTIQRVRMSSLQPIQDDLLPRVGIVYGTSDLHTASDYHSFTEMLDRVVRENSFSLQFTQISSLVNEAWTEMDIKQKSKTDIVEIGRNWKSYYWPSEKTQEDISQDSLEERLLGQQRLSSVSLVSPQSSTLMKLIEPIVKFVLPREENHSAERNDLLYSLDQSTEGIVDSHFKTALMLFRDVMKKFENNILPSNYEVTELYVKATEGWNFLKEESLIEKITLSKIRLFCKYFEVLISDDGTTLRNLDTLEPNERSYLSSFVNLELSRLDELSRKRLSNRKSSVDFQRFTDELDRIKILSYEEIKKEDYEEEQEGVITKFWTLSSNMVPEGEDDALSGQCCTFKRDSCSVCAEFLVFSDLDHNWVVKVRVEGSTLPVSLCAVERRNGMPAFYFPKIEKTENGIYFWNLNMRHLAAKDREVTLVFSFDGKLEEKKENFLSDLSWKVKSFVEENQSLIRSINERPYCVYPQYSGMGSFHDLDECSQI